MLLKLKCINNKEIIKKTSNIFLNSSFNNALFHHIKFNFSDNNKDYDKISEVNTYKSVNNPKSNLDFNIYDSVDIKDSIDSIQNKLKEADPLTVETVNDDLQRLPDYFKFYSVKLYDTKDIDQIKHDIEEDGIEYKYGLPVENTPYRPLSQLINIEDAEDSINTSTENLMELLDLDKLSAYESLVFKIDNEFNFGKK